jgi:glycosyltransferase involved in cell wall biosynthesis
MISSVFRPHLKGGAEISASNLSTWLVRQGHEVGVLAAAQTPDEACDGVIEEGARVWRVWPQRPYAGTKASKAPSYLKPVWHALDLFAPSNRQALAHVLDEFRPDAVNVQYIQGLGYNGLVEIGRRGRPTVFTIHDLGLACLRMAMFKGEHECATQCTSCRVTTSTKASYLRSIERLGFVSPSAAMLSKLQQIPAFAGYPSAVIRNANPPTAPTVARAESDIPRLLFVGRLHPAKGTRVMLDALEPLALTHRFELTVMGSGPDEDLFRIAAAERPWLSFRGQVTQQQVANEMQNSDVLLVPSTWSENSPGVVIEALSIGLPVMGSNKAGIPELVADGETGILVEPGNVEAWRKAIAGVLSDPGRLAKLHETTLARRGSVFDEDRFGSEMVRFIERIAGIKSLQAAAL